MDWKIKRTFRIKSYGFLIPDYDLPAQAKIKKLVINKAVLFRSTCTFPCSLPHQYALKTDIIIRVRCQKFLLIFHLQFSIFFLLLQLLKFQ